MGYRAEMQAYMDPTTGLVGIMPNNANYSSGNPLLETGTAYVFLSELGLMECIVDPNKLENTLLTCNHGQNLFYAKNPYGDDLISHDDLVGIFASLAYCPFLELGSDIITYGRHNKWVLSTTGKFYWDALVKPWHKAFYLLSVNMKPGYFNLLTLVLCIMFDALFNKESSSDKKLIWLMITAIKGRSKLVDLAAKFWFWRLKRVWGSMKRVFKVYYGESHIFTKYCWE